MCDWLQGPSHTPSRLPGFAAHIKSLTRKVEGKNSFVYCISSSAAAAKQERQSLQNSLLVNSVPLPCRFTACSRNIEVRRRRRSEAQKMRNIQPLPSFLLQLFPDHHIHAAFVQQCRCSCVCTIFLKEFSQAAELLRSSELRTGGDIFFENPTFSFSRMALF